LLSLIFDFLPQAGPLALFQARRPLYDPTGRFDLGDLRHEAFANAVFAAPGLGIIVVERPVVIVGHH